jgi:hypothetical protein
MSWTTTLPMRTRIPFPAQAHGRLRSRRCRETAPGSQSAGVNGLLKKEMVEQKGTRTLDPLRLVDAFPVVGRVDHRPTR